MALVGQRIDARTRGRKIGRFVGVCLILVVVAWVWGPRFVPGEGESAHLPVRERDAGERHGPRTRLDGLAPRDGDSGSELAEEREGVPPPADWIVRVVGDGGTPLEGAVLEAWAAGEQAWRHIARTNAGGEAAVSSVRRTERLLLRAWASGYLATEREVQPIPGGRTTIVLARGRVLRGVVEWEDGTVVGEGWYVLGWPAGAGWPDRAAVERVLSEGSRADLRIAITDPDGAFEVEGVPPDHPWRLVAIGPGGWSERPWAGVWSPLPVRLEVAAVYALRVRVTDEQGDPPRSAPWNAMGALVHWSERDDLESLGGGPDAWQRAFLDPAWTDGLDERNDRYSALLLYRGPPGRERTGPVQVTVNVPGYTPASPRECWLRPVGGPAVEETIVVSERSRCWGALEVRFEGSRLAPEDGSGSTAGELAEGELHLTNLETEEFWIRVIERFPKTPLVLDGLPCGNYQVVLSVGRGTRRNVSRMAVVADGEIRTVEFDVQPTGTVQVELRTAGGSPFSGAVQLLLLDERGHGDLVPLEHPPYTLVGCLPGVYRLRLFAVGGKPLAERAPEVEVHVEPGAIAQVTLTAPD